MIWRRYTIYNNETDFPVIVDGDRDECIKAMGIKPSTFYSTISLAQKGKNKKWTVLKSIDYELIEE